MTSTDVDDARRAPPISTRRSASPFPAATRAAGWSGSGRCSTRSCRRTIIRRRSPASSPRRWCSPPCSARCSRMPAGQLTLQAQTESGHRRPAGLRLSRRRAARLCPLRRASGSPSFRATATSSPCSARAISPSPSTSRWPSERYQGIVPLEGSSLAEAAQSYFSQSEQIPSLVRLAVDDTGHIAGGILVQHLPEGRGGARPAPHPARPSRMGACPDPRRDDQGPAS